MNQCSQERRRVRVGQRGHGATGPGKKDPSLGGVLPGLLRLQQGTPMRTRPCWSLGSFWNDYPNSVPYSLRQIRLEESKHEDDHLTSQQGNGTKRCPIQSQIPLKQTSLLLVPLPPFPCPPAIARTTGPPHADFDRFKPRVGAAQQLKRGAPAAADLAGLGARGAQPPGSEPWGRMTVVSSGSIGLMSFGRMTASARFKETGSCWILSTV